MKATYFASLFLLGCVASNLVGWMATIPGLFGLVWLFFGVGFITWLLALIFELPMIRVLRIDMMSYRALLFGFGAAAVIGVIVRLCSQYVLIGSN